MNDTRIKKLTHSRMDFTLKLKIGICCVMNKVPCSVSVAWW